MALRHLAIPDEFRLDDLFGAPGVMKDGAEVDAVLHLCRAKERKVRQISFVEGVMHMPQIVY